MEGEVEGGHNECPEKQGGPLLGFELNMGHQLWPHLLHSSLLPPSAIPCCSPASQG